MTWPLALITALESQGVRDYTLSRRSWGAHLVIHHDGDVWFARSFQFMPGEPGSEVIERKARELVAGVVRQMMGGDLDGRA